MFPAIPALGALRLATLLDVPRLAVVATSGFYYSPVFPWERPHHRDYPQDTFKSYEKMFADIIRDPQYVALVVEDAYQPTEAEKTQAIIDADTDLETPTPGDPIIVGAATWKLQLGSPRRGQFMDQDDDGKRVFDGGEGRDRDIAHAKLLDDKCDAAEEKYLSGHQLMDMVVVHPAYWRRGHGGTLVRWGMRLTDLDQVSQGVVAANMGEKLYLSLNYTKLDSVEAEDDAVPPNRVRVGILRYEPQNIREGKAEL